MVVPVRDQMRCCRCGFTHCIGCQAETAANEIETTD
jgi:hypothetical protein